MNNRNDDLVFWPGHEPDFVWKKDEKVPSKELTPPQTIEDKFKEIEALGFHGVTLERLSRSCQRVYDKLVKSGKKPKLALREISKRIRTNLPQNTEENARSCNNIHEDLNDESEYGGYSADHDLFELAEALHCSVREYEEFLDSMYPDPF